MGMMSKTKGKIGEREFAELLRAHGVEARRGQQFTGGGDSPDVVHSIAGVHFEVKRTEKLSLWPAYEQAQADAKTGDIAVVAHRPNRRPWVVVLGADDFIKLLLRGAENGTDHRGTESVCAEDRQGTRQQRPRRRQSVQGATQDA